MLAAQGVISADDHAAIQRGMAQITQDIESGQFEWKLALEDVHLNIEASLTALVGDAGKRLHTGRSRNDQVATDVRLWLRSEIDLISGLLTALQKALVEMADRNVDVILPGFTHLQVAQPVSFGHHHCWPMWKCSPATPSAWPTCASASTACRWVRPRWPAPATPSTASAWRAPWAWTASARTAWTRSVTATSPSSSPPPPRCAWCTSAGSAKS